MLRREFLGALPIVAAGAADGRVGNGQLDAAAPQIYEWRQYSLRTGMQPRRVADYLQNALIPALNRLGHSPVGVFEVTFGLPTPTVFVLTPFASADAFLAKESRLDNDATFIKSAAGYFDAVPADAAYVRQEVSVLGAFPRMPRIQVPVATATKGPRLFELRTYESHNERAHRAKVKMFAEMGEIDIFRRAGLTPVFFSRTLAGPRMPSLVYMLVHENLAAREKSWSAFGSDPEWKKLSATPGYTDPEIVSNITTVFLRPASYSQI
ncbi:MAG TPA: NIPSNAP family protein [Vicinamibacterales bacterium]|nr:NIPSNAP family protein [Vicinamibacterales bacterium]